VLEFVLSYLKQILSKGWQHMKPVNKSISSYWTDGKPSRGMGMNKGRATAIAYSENKVMLVSLPARLNNFKIPDLRDMAAIMRGDSVAIACAEFNAQATARARLAATTKYILVALDHMTPYPDFRAANKRACELAATGAPFGIWSCLTQEWAQEPDDSRIIAPTVRSMDAQTDAAIAAVVLLAHVRLAAQVAARPAFYGRAKPLHPTVGAEFAVLYALAPDGKPAYYWWERGNDTGTNCEDLAACEKSALAYLRAQVAA
jgi:hypothetical protein